MAVRGTKTQVTDKAVLDATGRHPDEWFAFLDAQQATGWTHTAIARWLLEQGVDGWWAQGITVRYEQARGMRLPGQAPDGSFEVSVSRTIDAEQAEALQAIIGAVTEVHGEPAAVNPTAKYPTARWKPGSGGTLLATASPSKNGRTSVVLSWSKLPDAAALEAAKPALRGLLDALG